jgi:PilZ domain
MNIKKIYANNSDKGTLVCEKCGKTKTVDLSEFKNIGKPLKVKCGCGHVFFVSIEIRKFYRKNTNLVGEYIRISSDMSKGLERGSMTVEDLSRTGLGFRTKTNHNIYVRDVIRVRFILDDAKRSEVNKSAVVRRVNNSFVSAEFLDFDGFNETNRTLGFYLMPR